MQAVTQQWMVGLVAKGAWSLGVPQTGWMGLTLLSWLSGMVEMIPNAETLRKIQVEHGVTGSFKDRPLADWLQKHNPEEDEYEKVRRSLAGSPLLVPPTPGIRPLPSQRVQPFSTPGCSFPPSLLPGCGKFHLLLCWLLRGHLCAGNLRPAQ